MTYDRRTAGLSYGVVRQEAGKLMNNVEPIKSRTKVIQQIVRALPDFPILLTAFKERAPDGKVTYQDVGDLLGQAIANWKQQNWLDRDDTLEELSYDPKLVSAIGTAVRKFKSTEPLALPRDYSEATSLAHGMLRLLEELSSGSTYKAEATHEECLRRATRIVELLK